jgi:LysR family hydrogen peroxide-inducible transcriptional activator
MMNITIKQLKYFEALTKQGHFGRAAATCAISQPALSVQIKELEIELGQGLFERGPRQVHLTAFGKDFALRVREILQAIEELGDFARAAHSQLAGRFRLGVIPTIAPYLLPSLIGDLANTHPDLDLHIRETLTPRLVQELQDGQIDTAIVALPVSEATFTEMPLFDESFVLVRPISAAQDPVPNSNALRDMRLLLLEEGHCFRDQALSFCSTGTALPRDGLDGSSLSTLVQMVGAGIGVTMIPEMAIAVEARSAPVDCAYFSDPQPGRTIGMIWRKTNPLAPQLTEIAEVVRQCAKKAAAVK